MPLQRRYSVTGQTPPDDVGAMKPHSSPKLQALDTSVQTTSCGLCEGGGDAAKTGTASSVDDAAGEGGGDRGRRMAHHTAVRTSSKRSATQLPSPNTPSSHELPTKIARLGLEHDDMEVDEGCLTDPFPEDSDWPHSSFDDSSSASAPPSPVWAPSSLPDEPMVEPLELEGLDEMVVEDLALSPEPTTDDYLPTTLLTLPPELRHQIYRHLPDLVLPYPLIYCLSTFANNMQHPLASVSRLIRSEALAIFYSYNTWIIKLEFKMMYEAFQDWIIRLGEGAGLLRLVTIAVRGRLFKPKTSHASSININGQILQIPGLPGAVPVEEYHPPDGDASFNIDLSEKYPGGKVELVRNDGTKGAGEDARKFLAKMVEGLWEKRRTGTLNGQDWVNMVDAFLAFTGWW
ncbi:hypothetical protein BU26DRAFT_185949 [Trematosphaeria pertusa]|uniref:F-box domain-containing protein n=1 Tax=Trematosphaeria pertusa TaxID=390896 RepID=A0A6A6HTA6_9PLEO|nr:uncharacterized protein BU26DRAFT_185949 [Trematosphaeria pertusa]KAF2241012.1 hypothetical protein BU26DRAFT_185949 [Trematosphaeria pertusa]